MQPTNGDQRPAGWSPPPDQQQPGPAGYGPPGAYGSPSGYGAPSGYGGPGGYGVARGLRPPELRPGVQYGPGPRLPIIHPDELRPGRAGYIVAAILAAAALIGGSIGFGVNIALAVGAGDDISSKGTVQLGGAAQRGIYLTRAHRDSKCTVRDSAGGLVPLDAYAKDDESGRKDGATYYLSYTFKAPKDDTYSLECRDTSTGVDAGTTYKVLLGPPSADQVFSSSGTAFALLFGLGGGGVLLAAALAAWTGSARVRDRRRRQEDIMRSNPPAYNWSG